MGSLTSQTSRKAAYDRNNMTSRAINSLRYDSSGEGADITWLKKESVRRNVPMAQILRDAFRAYRNLCKESAKYEGNGDSKQIPVNF